MPVLRLRLAAPSVIVDVTRVDELKGIRDAGDAIVIGAGATHDEVMRSAIVQQHAGLLAAVEATVADPQIRHRGTLVHDRRPRRTSHGRSR